MTTIAIALAMMMIAPLVSADSNNAQSHHDDQSHQDQSDNEDNDQDDSGTVSNTFPGNTNTSPIAIYTHLDFGICTIDPITSASKGWCPDGVKSLFFIPNSNVTQYSVIALTTVPPVMNPLSTVQCVEQIINYTVGSNQGFGISCNYPVLPGSGLNYIIFNPGLSWYAQHNIIPVK